MSNGDWFSELLSQRVQILRRRVTSVGAPAQIVDKLDYLADEVYVPHEPTEEEIKREELKERRKNIKEHERYLQALKKKDIGGFLH